MARLPTEILAIVVEYADISTVKQFRLASSLFASVGLSRILKKLTLNVPEDICYNQSNDDRIYFFQKNALHVQ